MFCNLMFSQRCWWN